MEEEQGLTLGEILKIIFKRVWWVVGAMAVCVLAAVLLVQFWYNKSKVYYPVSYQISYPDSSAGKYPDGTEFSIYDSVSLNVLKEVKEGKYSSAEDKELFASIDVEKMVDKDYISIKSEMTQLVDGTIVRMYTLNVKARCFTGAKQAERFIKAVAGYPVKVVNSVVERDSYGLLFDTYDKAESYEDMISALAGQKDYIIEKYDLLVGVGGNVVLTNRTNVENLYTLARQQDLLNEIQSKKLVLDPEEYLVKAENSIGSKIEDVKDYQTRIDAQDEAIKQDVTNVVVYSETKSKLLDEQAQIIVEIKKELTTLNEMCDQDIKCDKIDEDFELDFSTLTVKQSYSAANAAFKAKLDGYKTKLEEATETLKQTTISLYADNTRVIYDQNVIKAKGGINIILAAVIGAVVGFLIAALVIWIIDVPKYKRDKLKGNAQPTEEKSAVEINSAVEAESAVEEKGEGLERSE